jgi:NADH-quinone oxidoreductase subunit C
MADDTPPANDITPADEPAVDATPREPETIFGAPVTHSHGQVVVHVDHTGYLELVGKLHDDGHLACIDVTAVDYLTYEADRGLPPGIEAQRFEVVASFVNHARRERLRLRVQVPEDDPTVPSITDLYPGADALEREVFDMFGIAFTGHPDMSRILMPEDWVGHPLRKDYNSGRIPVQFKEPANSPGGAGTDNAARSMGVS